MLFNLLSNLLIKEDFATGRNRRNFYANFFSRSIYALSFGQYEITSSETMRFCGSISMRFRWLEPPQFPLHASQFAFKSGEK